MTYLFTIVMLIELRQYAKTEAPRLLSSDETPFSASDFDLAGVKTGADLAWLFASA